MSTKLTSPCRGGIVPGVDDDLPMDTSRDLFHFTGGALAYAGHYHRGDIVGRLSLVFSQLGQAVAQTGAALPGQLGPAHPAVGQAMRLLEAEVARSWTLTELAGELHLAPGYLVRLFKAATGLPPMAYLARLRAEHAAVLLLHSGEPVASIGPAVGRPDQNYFARRFKAHYGLSATTYRSRFATDAGHIHQPVP